jgi:hypothetical protein
MMFAGTYHSEFYRAIRNLLHDQAREPDSADVHARWDALLSREAHYRYAPESPATLGFDAAPAFN